MNMPIDLFEVLSRTKTSRETAETILNIIRSNPKVDFDVKIHNIAIDDEIIKILAETLFLCEQQGSQVSLTGNLSKEVLSRIIEEKGKLLNEIKTEWKERDTGVFIDAKY